MWCTAFKVFNSHESDATVSAMVVECSCEISYSRTPACIASSWRSLLARLSIHFNIVPVVSVSRHSHVIIKKTWRAVHHCALFLSALLLPFLTVLYSLHDRCFSKCCDDGWDSTAKLLHKVALSFDFYSTFVL